MVTCPLIYQYKMQKLLTFGNNSLYTVIFMNIEREKYSLKVYPKFVLTNS